MEKKFIELPNKNTVIAKMSKKHSVVEELASVNKKYEFILNRIDFMFNRSESSNPYFESKAIADENDTFDAKIGKEIAAQKVDYKYHKSMIAQYNRYIDLLNSMIETLENLRNKHITKKRKIESNMKQYVQEENN